jgi:hypothetical protein
LHFDGQELSGRLRIEDQAVTLSLKEERPPYTILEVSDDGQGQFRLMLMQDAGEVLLSIRSEKGSFRLVHVDETQQSRYAAASFLDFYRRHRRYVETQLLPMLRQVGISPPLVPYDPPVKAAVIGALRGAVGADEAKQVEALIRQLNDEAHARRQQASRLLADNFLRYRALLEKASGDPNLPSEAAERIKQIMSAAARADQVEEIVSGLNLTGDVEYLVGLLGEIEAGDSTARGLVAARLEALTGQKLGDDPAAWKNWLSRRPASAPAAGQ